MKNRQIAALLLCGAMSLSLLAGCAGKQPAAAPTQTQTSAQEESAAAVQPEETAPEETTQENSTVLSIAEQGVFSAGGITVTSDGTFDPENQWEETGAGQTAHVDHANVLYQIPAEETGLPMVFLHGYGQSRMGWMTTPDGREGWSEMFLRKGHGVFLIDEPRRGEAGATSVSGDISTKTLDQRWYTQFRIGRWENGESVVNEGSQFPNDAASVDQFFRQMTPDTGMTSDMGGDFDNETVAKAVAATIDEVYERTGKNSILVTHSQGGGPGWTAVQHTDHIAAIVAIEPGGAPGADSEDMQKRIERFGLTGKFAYRGYPTTFWDIYQTGGHAVRATVSEMGPELLSRILGLSEAQTGVLQIVFRVADDRGLLLDDLKDLRALLNYVNDHKEDYRMKYGNITTQSVAAILRALLPLEKEGGELFFGEPVLDVNDWIRTDAEGRGMVNVLDCVKLVQNPTLYASFLLWLLSELFETMPEVGDLEKPKLVFFFDEAHMLFRDAPAVLVQKIEQTVKLIRSRGIGVFFVTQSPADVPDTVLAQLSNRVQHALRAYTPTELKAVRVAAQAFRENPAFNAEDAIMELGVGEALTSFLGEDGIPAMVQRTKIICPQSLMGAPEAMTRAKTILRDGMEKYDEAEDNVSAYEVLADETQAAEEALAQERERLEEEKRAAEEEKRAAEEEKQRRKQAEADEKRAQKLEDEARRRAQKLEDEERRRAQKLEDEARRKAEREKEKKEAEEKRKAERIRSKIETQLISAGGQMLKRGLLGILKK